MHDRPQTPLEGAALPMRFKTVNGMEACTTATLLEGVVTRQNSSFWKVFGKAHCSIAFSEKIYHMSFRKVL